MCFIRFIIQHMDTLSHRPTAAAAVVVVVVARGFFRFFLPCPGTKTGAPPPCLLWSSLHPSPLSTRPTTTMMIIVTSANCQETRIIMILNGGSQAHVRRNWSVGSLRTRLKSVEAQHPFALRIQTERGGYPKQASKCDPPLEPIYMYVCMYVCLWRL